MELNSSNIHFLFSIIITEYDRLVNRTRDDFIQFLNFSLLFTPFTVTRFAMHRNHALHDFAPQLSDFFSPFSLVPSPGRKILRTSSVNKKSQGQFSLSLTQIVFDNMSQCLKPGVSSLFTHIPAEQSCLMASFLSFCVDNKAGDSGRTLILIHSYHHRKSTVN